MKKQSHSLEMSQLYDYQIKAIKFMIGQACAGLFLDPGLGKTVISLTALATLKSKKFIKGTLVISPIAPMYNTWPQEIAKWKHTERLTCGILHGPSKLEVLKGPQRDIYLINPEGIAWLAPYVIGKSAKRIPFDVLIVDESTKFKNSQSVRFKLMREFIEAFKRRYILTGTPMPQSYIDLFGQIYLLDQGNSLGFYVTHYRNEYFFTTIDKPFQYQLFPGAGKKITKRMAPLVMRMRWQDYISLPKKKSNFIWLEIPDDVREQYDSMEEDFLAVVENDIITAPSAAAAGMKCRQMINGAIYTNAQKKEWIPVHDVKMDRLKELVEELSGQPLLLFYEFRHDRERLEKALGWECITGMGQRRLNETLELFNSGLLPGIIAHPASAGHGLNLQHHCAHVCWFGLTWNFEHYDQAIRRVWRHGNKADRVVIHHLCMKDSLDEEVIGVLKRKRKTMAKFMSAIKRLQEI